MAADQERAERIRALKQERPDLTWRRIAEYVGVTERSATDWQRKGGIEYDNAKKLAELLEVDVDYIWRGTDTGTPSPFAGGDDIADRLDRIETRIDQIHEMLTAVLTGGETEDWQRIARTVLEGDPEAPSGKPRVPQRSSGAATKRAARPRTG